MEREVLVHADVSYSPLVGCDWASASSSASKGRTAHLTRLGNRFTPASALRSPSSFGSAGPSGASPSVKAWRRLSTAATRFPFTRVVSIDAAAWEIEHPRPSKVTSAMRPPSTRAQILTVSPQKGLWAWPLVAGASRGPRLRGLRKWSRITA